MDVHLSTLDATLASIAQLQRHVLTNPKPQPFTNAYLAPIDATLLASPRPPRDFIRECDAFERRLFHFPAPGGMIDDGSDSSAADRMQQQHRDVEEEAADVAAELVPRKPEIRTVSVPTPLRPSAQGGGNRNGGARGSKQYDARASLMAAQRLNDNYQRAPRARKHIRHLLKRNTELSTAASAHTAQAAKLEDVLARIASGQDPNTMMDELSALLDGSNSIDAPTATSSTSQDDKAKKRRLREMREKLQTAREELNREEMEVLALEEMREDMLRRRKAVMAKKAGATGASGPSTDAPGKRVPRVVAAAQAQAAAAGASKPRTSADASTSSSPKAAKSTAPLGPGVRKLAASARGRPSVALPQSKPAESASASASAIRKPSTTLRKPSAVGAGPRGSVVKSVEPAPAAAATTDDTLQPEGGHHDDGDDDITVRLKPGESQAPTQEEEAEADESLLLPPPTTTTPASTDPLFRDPESTDELERLSEKVWDTFGEHLRFFASHLESADATTTLGLLRKLLGASTLEGAAGGAARGGGGDDGSSVSSGAATSSSTASSSAAGTAVAPPTVQARITALTLLHLLTSSDAEQPHSVEFPLLKTRARRWYEDEVSEEERLVHQREEGGATDGEALVTKAVYALVAKKLLRIRRSGGMARVGFS
ncbi:hypothetical protein BDZ90DRAFT_230732 [Jaminaea rosea]|uniref:Uncharacterized protein n=1 Tax=Jaminaea rosea TaxID=1569628 RepID=A0A316UTU4_9BASI|nr:hypothetical protein BDZ90DRAFT_230732 [Jaminaea rosea]PWN28709.1 hypothetical protein BDZ90DRAFT_230732 [Jaminaea rosea]